MAAICPMCNGTGEVDWMNARQAAQFLGVSEVRVRQLIADGLLPGAVKYTPPGHTTGYWKIPLASVAARMESRRYA
jgi:hypothetical protein